MIVRKNVCWSSNCRYERNWLLFYIGTRYSELKAAYLLWLFHFWYKQNRTYKTLSTFKLCMLLWYIATFWHSLGIFYILNTDVKSQSKVSHWNEELYLKSQINMIKTVGFRVVICAWKQDMGNVFTNCFVFAFCLFVCLFSVSQHLQQLSQLTMSFLFPQGLVRCSYEYASLQGFKCKAVSPRKHPHDFPFCMAVIHGKTLSLSLHFQAEEKTGVFSVPK